MISEPPGKSKRLAEKQWDKGAEAQGGRGAEARINE
jgi:hypothetical protein